MNGIAGSRRKTAVRIMAALVLPALLLLGAGREVSAAGGLQMSTGYPGMVVTAGDELSFALDFTNTTGAGMAVSLETVSLPEGWEGYFTGNGSEVSQVYVKNGENEGTAAYSLSIPEEAAGGDYEVVLRAYTGGEASDTLTLNLKVTEEELGGSSFQSEYPEQEGSAGANFSFDTTLVNNSASEQNYSFSSNAPSGWNVTFTPSGESSPVNSITLEPRKSQTITVGVTPAADAQAGAYTISCAAVSAGENLKTELTATITGQYALDVTTPSGRLSTEAYANKQKEVALKIVNNGNTDLTNVTLSSSAPDGWTVSFSQPTIDVIEAGASVEVTAYMTPGEDSLSGDYVVSIKASNSDTSDNAEFRISVKTETIWGVVGVLLIVCVFAGIGWVFHKYGRR
ncbi:NEW3 domain-containing protein [Eisenbergiella sp.]|uniref:NEW3 domain-containing protein n=1 Tax=Eisenbergiella sp. TaxID=1924109 RepID=UPI00208D43D0|nr:NEW3 domain-containing protein [Eisenbergiella sp.]BDF45303.1 ABC transporter substrate-binding protein [Lachnospiraceae bacterium]GKH41370.1 ABC transporter substrate-binding protein [Lachnospiraceae bacterium]